MTFAMIKRYMPKSLFGRGVLILLVPVLSILLIVSFAFVQRHFDGVTRQLARGVALEVAALADQVERYGAIQPDHVDLARRLGLTISMVSGTVEPGETRDFYDISGRLVYPIMQEVTNREVSVDLVQNWRRVDMRVATARGILAVNAPRGRMSASNPHQLLVLMFSGAILLTIISLMFLRNQVRPIRRLAQAAEAFGKGQTVPFRPAGAEEVRRAGNAFIAMRNRIERQIEQRTMMLSGVSHDLRTPLTRMKLALATADTVEDLEPIKGDLAEMERMLEEFLTFARDATQDGAVMVDLNKLLAGIVEDAVRSGHSVTYASVDTGTEVSVRAVALRRAIQNLIDNACRYGNEVSVRLHMARRRVEIVVEDDGTGIPEDERQSALRPFSRLDPARNQDQGGGTGLGLAIALDVARVHGGTVELGDSEALGGLKATLQFPRFKS